MPGLYHALPIMLERFLSDLAVDGSDPTAKKSKHLRGCDSDDVGVINHGSAPPWASSEDVEKLLEPGVDPGDFGRHSNAEVIRNGNSSTAVVFDDNDRLLSAGSNPAGGSGSVEVISGASLHPLVVFDDNDKLLGSSENGGDSSKHSKARMLEADNISKLAVVDDADSILCVDPVKEASSKGCGSTGANVVFHANGNVVFHVTGKSCGDSMEVGAYLAKAGCTDKPDVSHINIIDWSLRTILDFKRFAEFDHSGENLNDVDSLVEFLGRDLCKT